MTRYTGEQAIRVATAFGQALAIDGEVDAWTTRYAAAVARREPERVTCDVEAADLVALSSIGIGHAG